MARGRKNVGKKRSLLLTGREEVEKSWGET
jgi:hypothetical protein